MPEVKGSWFLDDKKYSLTNNAKIMHCLPVRREVELSSKLIDGPNSLIQAQASNRVHSALAVLKQLLTDNKVKVSNEVLEEELLDAE